MGKLFNESGGDNDSRVTEARKLFSQIEQHYAVGELNEWETGFMESIGDQLDLVVPEISVKQLFKLRDIRDRYDQ